MSINQVPGSVLFEFSDPARVIEWQAINDGVMGGLSRSAPRIIDGALHFAGAISLDNNGGFASIRVSLGGGLGNASGLLLRLMGDGRSYQCRLYSDVAEQGSEIAFSQSFQTEANKWLEVPIAFSQLKPVFRGRVLSGPEFDPKAAVAMGFMLADRQPGPFLLCVEWIRLIRSSGPMGANDSLE
jgi:NADH dehydrogenase [ubiquinone] 1 alpha subcomplex assembly factor 1